MSRKRKKKAAGMSDNAAQAMYEYGKEKYELATRVTRGVDSVGSLAFAQHCSSYAKDGFKKGYDYGRREEREKSFNYIKFIEQFGREASDLARKYGLYFHVSDVSLEASPCSSPCGAKVKVGINCFSTAESVKQAYINWKDE